MNKNPSHEELDFTGNNCFGCGKGNPSGLRISVYRDQHDPRRILGKFSPQEYTTGFPGMIHGGAIYTALDCMATWSGMALRGTKALWVLRSSTMKYHRPAFQGKLISLSAVIVKEGGEWEAIEVRAEARDLEDNLLAEGSFKVIPVSPEKFMTITGIDNMPAGWAHWLSDNNTSGLKP
jgi:acyl-coenzyme A thioesterase PaaI-like protein